MHIFICTYKPPDSNLNEFLCDLDQVLANIAKENKLVFLMGDWNLNLTNHHCHKATSDFWICCTLGCFSASLLVLQELRRTKL